MVRRYQEGTRKKRGNRMSSFERDMVAPDGRWKGEEPVSHQMAEGFAMLIACDCGECGQGESDLFIEEPTF